MLSLSNILARKKKATSLYIWVSARTLCVRAFAIRVHTFNPVKMLLAVAVVRFVLTFVLNDQFSAAAV